MTDRHLARIAALLRKAEGTDNAHEADAYLQAAQRLATLASVDLAVARAHTDARERREAPTQRVVTIGTSGKRGLRTYAHLFLAIAGANNLTCDIARDSSVIYAYGFEGDIDTVEAMYASLVVQMVRACDAYLASPEHAADSTLRQILVPGSTRRDRWGRVVQDVQVQRRPVHATTARINFQQAFAARIGARLAEARQQAEQQAREDEHRTAARSTGPDPIGVTTGPTGAGDPAEPASGVALALRARELELAEHYRAHSTARGSWTGARATAGASERSRRAGDRAGRRARLGGERAIGGSRPGLDAGE
ncbi:DUF2786 domain-containing protein [Nakamurella leprariae]|uniref:DUF2786 domain-containing protein n=1 Tax=Nakamurella leprariae TaxID=2803911 RepID=A0A938YEP8_9ACTN|nr:DUF2786 domain-containing protein [Nakamurella leprariae]MBM9468484.1 DUF2786 domain-containing protein [Nakamurella leprariae]